MTAIEVTTACAICGGARGSVHRVREMMFGTRDSYEYFRCADCGCCQLRGPVETATHYPPDYHAFQVQPRPTGARGLLRRLRNRGVFARNIGGRLLNVVAPYPVPGAHRWFQHMSIDRDSRILDVGCGAAELIRDMREVGFAAAEGIDPLIPDDVLRASGGGVSKQWLHEATGVYDVVMMHHVLEHMPDQEDAMRHVARLLRVGGTCLVRIPVMPSFAWDRYGENWVQLDAPRHLFLHSERSLAMVAARAGLTLEHVEHDSTEFQFAGSELYVRDLPLSSLPSAYSRRQLHRFRRDARKLNRARQGDQAAFYFRKTS
jgi:SAM-dependent methyltransferase